MQSAAHSETPSKGSTQDDASRLQDVIDRIYEKYRNVEEGTVATYIPELGKANPNHFGICLTTAGGRFSMDGSYGLAPLPSV